MEQRLVISILFYPKHDIQFKALLLIQRRVLTCKKGDLLVERSTNFSRERRAMQDMIRELRLAYQSLHQDLEEEKRARKQLESQIQKLLILTPSK